MMSAYPLSKPGDVSEWISIGEAYLKAGGEPAAWVDGLKAVEVQVKVMPRRDVIRLSEASAQAHKAEEGAGRRLAVLDADEAWIAAGLARMRGVGRDVDKVDGDLLEALASSHLTWLVAMVVREFNELDCEARRGFFTQAQAG